METRTLNPAFENLEYENDEGFIGHLDSWPDRLSDGGCLYEMPCADWVHEFSDESNDC